MVSVFPGIIEEMILQLKFRDFDDELCYAPDFLPLSYIYSNWINSVAASQIRYPESLSESMRYNITYY